VLCNSEWTRARIREFAGDAPCPELAVVLGGVDTQRFRPLDRAAVRREIGWPEGDEVAFLAARHTIKKGIDTAIEAVKLLEKRRPALRLLIAGYGTETDNLRALTEELGLEDRVRFVGGLPHSLMHRYLAAADVALAPSRDVYDPRRFAIDYETMGRMICEAAACGVPTVASDCGGIPEVVLDGETGLLSRPNDAESVAAALDCLLSDRERARGSAKRAPLGRGAAVVRAGQHGDATLARGGAAVKPPHSTRGGVGWVRLRRRSREVERPGRSRLGSALCIGALDTEEFDAAHHTRVGRERGSLIGEQIAAPIRDEFERPRDDRRRIQFRERNARRSGRGRGAGGSLNCRTDSMLRTQPRHRAARN
jgi:hypothetical protein